MTRAFELLGFCVMQLKMAYSDGAQLSRDSIFDVGQGMHNALRHLLKLTHTKLHHSIPSRLPGSNHL